MNGPRDLADLTARLELLEQDLTVLGSIVDDLQAYDSALPRPTDASAEAAGAAGTSRGTPSRTDASHAGVALGGDDLGEDDVAPFYGSLLEFVEEGFAPVYCRATSPTIRWCPCWWDHAEAIYRLEALWRSWELYRLEPRLGIASWLRDYLDPQLRELTSPTGPFAQCTDDRHSPVRPLRTEQPPAHYFDDL